jgi:hypothetical protein
VLETGCGISLPIIQVRTRNEAFRSAMPWTSSGSAAKVVVLALDVSVALSVNLRESTQRNYTDSLALVRDRLGHVRQRGLSALPVRAPAW